MKNFFLKLALVIKGLFASAVSSRYLDPQAAADVYADTYTSLYVNSPPTKVGGKQLAGRVRILRATYTQGAADGAIGDRVFFGKLPAGASPIPFGKTYFSAGNAGATMKFGITGNDDCFLAATSIAAQGSAVLEAEFAGGANLDQAAEIDVFGTNAVAAIKAGQKITVWIPYVMND